METEKLEKLAAERSRIREYLELVDWNLPKFTKIKLEEGETYLYKTDILKRKCLPIAPPIAIRWTSYDYAPVWRESDIRPQTEEERAIERAYENERRRIARIKRKKEIAEAEARIKGFFDRIRERAAATYGPNTVWIDTETTGLGMSDEPVELTIRDLNGVLLDTLIKPANHTDWPGAEAIHGISPDMVANAPSMAQIAGDVAAILKGRIVAGYNVSFDLRMLKQAGVILEQPKFDPELAEFWKGLAEAGGDTGAESLKGMRYEPIYADSICLMHLFAKYYGDYSEYHGSYTWQKLVEAAEFFNIEFPGEAHRSGADCIVSQRLHELMITAPDVSDHAIWYLEGYDRIIDRQWKIRNRAAIYADW